MPKNKFNLRKGEMIIEINIHNLLGKTYWNRSEKICNDILTPDKGLADQIDDCFSEFTEQFKKDICYIAEYGHEAYEQNKILNSN